MTEPSGKRRTSAVARLAAPLILIALGGCDNVEWGGVQFSVVPPPPTAEAPESELEAAERLPDGPILYHVRHDSAGTEVVPVAAVMDGGMESIEPGSAPEEFGARFIAAHLRQGAELTLFHTGRRAGTLIIDSAGMPTGSVCRPLPRATGRVELSGDLAGATEFLAMARTQAPDGRALPGTPAVDRRMQVLGPIMAERALRARGAQLPNWRTALRQLFPFPTSEARDLAFTATFLVDDELQVGNDDQGYSLFIVYTPQAQTGYDTAYVSYRIYGQGGKAAPRVIDFLDWDRDGSPELLLEVYGTRNSWFEVVGRTEDGWEKLLEERCDTPTAVAADTAGTDTAAAPAPAPARPRPQPARPPAQTDTAAPTQASIPLTDIEPLIRLAVPDTSGV